MENPKTTLEERITTSLCEVMRDFIEQEVDKKTEEIKRQIRAHYNKMLGKMAVTVASGTDYDLRKDFIDIRIHSMKEEPKYFSGQCKHGKPIGQPCKECGRG